MKIIVTSKYKFPDKVRETRESGQKWAYISIEGSDDMIRYSFQYRYKHDVLEDNEHYLEDGPDVLNINFDDISEDMIISDEITLRAITPNQARQIYDFAESHQDCNILVHCLAGQSRSQGVARALWDIFPDTWQECSENLENPCHTPNMAVVSAIKHVYYEKLYS